MLITDLLWLFAAFFVLIRSADFVIKSLGKISAALRLTEFIVGFVIVAFSTSLPEFFVGITSSLKKVGELSVGNIIGANINDMSLVMGLSILLCKGIKLDAKKMRADFWFMFLAAASPAVLLMDKTLSRIDGLILIAIFIFYIWSLFRQKKVLNKLKAKREKDLKKLSLSFLILFVGIALLLISSRFVVKYATSMAADLGVSNLLIGLLVVAVGTTLPELAFSYRAVLLRRNELLIGDLVGSVIVNSSLILGIAAVINPITAPFTQFAIGALFLLAIILILIKFAESKKGLERKEGIALIMVYLLFLATEFYFKHG